MKARIRKTGAIINLSEYARIELDACDSFGNPIELKPEEVELIHDVKEDNFPNTDWNQVRVQASIGAMQVILGKNNYDTYKEIASQAVGYADALVKELKNNKGMNEISIIINGVRYDAEPVSTNSPLTNECLYCDLRKEDGASECLKLSHCPLFLGYIFKKSTKSFKR